MLSVAADGTVRITRRNFVTGLMYATAALWSTGRRALADASCQIPTIQIPFYNKTCSPTRNVVRGVTLTIRGTDIDPTRNNLFIADTLTIVEDLILHGHDLVLVARVVSVPTSVTIDVSALAPPAPLPAPAQVGGDGETGTNGADGDKNTSLAGNVSIYAGDLQCPNLTINATGGTGQAGQDGGQGGLGYPQPQMTDDYICSRAEGYFPGNPGHPGHDGGKGGAAGAGSEPTPGGNVSIFALSPLENSPTILNSGGVRGADGAPGKGGAGGAGQEGSEAWSLRYNAHLGRPGACVRYPDQHTDGAPGHDGQLGDPASHGPNSVLDAARGTVTLTAPASFADLAYAQDIEQIRLSLQWVTVQLASGDLIDMVGPLTWLVGVSSARSDEAVWPGVNTIATEFLARTLSGTDLFGNAPNEVPILAQSNLQGDLEAELTALDALQEVYSDYYEKYEAGVISFDILQTQADALNARIGDDQLTIGTLSAETLNSNDIISSLTQKMSSSIANLQNALEAYNVAIQNEGTGCQLDVTTLVMIGASVVGIATGTYDALHAGLSIYNNLTDHTENHDNLKKDGGLVWSSAENVANDVKSLNRDFTPDQQQRIKLALDEQTIQSNVGKIEDTIKKTRWAPGCCG